MSASREPKPAGFASFRARLQIGMMIVIVALTLLGLYLAQRNVAANAGREREREFKIELDALQRVQDIRHGALAELCRSLARKARIHAALEDGAPDLLYPSARDALRDLMDGSDVSGEKPLGDLHAKFYRFLDAKGVVIPPRDSQDAGALPPEEESRLSLPSLNGQQQLGYLARASGGVDEIIATPIVSSETDEVIAAIVLGFEPAGIKSMDAEARIRRGILVDRELHLTNLDSDARELIVAQVQQASSSKTTTRMETTVGKEPHLLLFKHINPGSKYAPASEVSLYPLSEAIARQTRIRWQILGAGAVLLIAGLIASHLLAARLSHPVEKLAADSERHRARREIAEAALEQTSAELQRPIRFSSDASHQLKTPVTVLRAGLEELLAREDVPTEVREELSSLVGQTSRLSGVIENLLLLSRLDEGRLKLDFAPVNLTELIEEWLDDFSALEDSLGLKLENGVTPNLMIVGERRYSSMIVQNLLENARKYNRPGGLIRIRAHRRDALVIFNVANTGRPIPPESQEMIFERFHRGASGENVPGHGLGLNLARELARLHDGDLRLIRSDSSWTEFEARFRAA